MRDDAVCRRTFGGWHLPLVGSSLDQHDARGCATLADIVCRGANAAAAAGGEIPPGALAGDALAWRGIFGRDFRPVAFQFVGNELSKSGERALAHFRAGNADHDGVVGPDHDPGTQFGRAIGGAHHGGAAKGDVEAERETGAERGAADDEGATIESWSIKFWHMIHDDLPYAFAAA